MNRRTTLAVTPLALLCLAVALPAGNAAAQQKQQVSINPPVENSKYTEKTENIEVGDVPKAHFEIHYTFPLEEYARGIGDLIDGNGSATQHLIFVMENGDKFFARVSNVVQTTSGKSTATQVGYITGGTGKFAAIQGIVRAVANFDLKTGFNKTQADIEYSIGK